MKQQDFKTAINALKSAGTDIVRSDCETHYVHTPTGTKLQRCTTFITGAAPFVMPEAWAGSSAIGTDADQLVRDYYVNGADSINRNDYQHLSDVAFIQLTAAIKAYDESVVKAQGWKVLADRVFLYSLEMGVAGEVDLILYNEETEEIKIIDMKTVRSPKYNTSTTGKTSKKAKYTRQLNTYRAMAEELTGRQIDSLEIMWIKVFYEKYQSITTEAYLHAMETIPMRDVSGEIAEIWMEEKGYHYRDHNFEVKPDEVTEDDFAALISKMLA